MLALMYFVRRLSAAGGVLCLDEPEQHLHPTLQAALFDVMGDLAERAQVIAVSHSVNLIASAPMSGLVQMSAPNGVANQLSRLKDEPERSSLIATLGITPADLLQSDLLCVVEGDRDQQWLRMTMPVELGRAHLLVAGSGNQVVDANDTLEKAPVGIPWICVRDRDLMSDDEVSRLTGKRPNLHVWPRREVESLVLDARLVSSVLVSVGRDVDESEAAAMLAQAAEPLKGDVLEALVQSELNRSFPPPGKMPGDRFSRLEAEYRDYADVNRNRADNVQAVLEGQTAALDARWAEDWPVLVDPKVVFARLAEQAEAFHDDRALVAALFARARDDESVRPQAIEEFRVKLIALLDE